MAKLRNRYKDKSPQDALARREQSIKDRQEMIRRATGQEGESDEDYLERLSLRMGSWEKPEPAPRLPSVTRTGKALGFRSWKLSGYELRSANEAFGGWKIDEPTEAECMGGQRPAWSMVASLPPELQVPEQAHEAPHPDCECGLYALHAPEFMSRWHHDKPLMVHGAVLGWGRMEVHHEGWRAQYAQPVMLAFDGDRQPYNHCERVKAMGAELGLPVVEWPEFEAEARKLAEPVPEDLRPGPPHVGFDTHGGWGHVRIRNNNVAWFAPYVHKCACGWTTHSPAPITQCGHCGA